MVARPQRVIAERFGALCEAQEIEIRLAERECVRQAEPEALMTEPTETEPKERLDAFVEAMRRIAEEAATSPEVLHEAPHGRPVRRLDEVRAAKRPVVRHDFGEQEIATAH